MDLKELVELMAKALVTDPSQVEVRVRDAEDSIVVELHAAKGDMGRLVGKSGRTANALRAILHAAARRQGKKATFEIL